MSWYKKGTPLKQIHRKRQTTEERFFDKVAFIPFHPCWEWVGTRSEWGYGQLWIGDGTRQAANRWSYERFKGPIAPGLVVCHKCDNPGCVNPDHLFLGTNKENSIDCMAKGRTIKGRGKKVINQDQKSAIAGMVACGVPQRKVAEKLGISPKTVRKYAKTKCTGGDTHGG